MTVFSATTYTSPAIRQDSYVGVYLVWVDSHTNRYYRLLNKGHHIFRVLQMVDIPSVRVLLTTGRTVAQGRTIELGKMSQEYIDSTAICEFHESVLHRIGVKDGELVYVRTAWGSVCVRARIAKQSEQEDLAFMPVGPYANALVSGDTGHLGMPEFKHIEAEVSRADGMVLKSPQELLSSIMEE